MSDVKVCLHDSVPGIEIHNNVQSFLPGIDVHCTPAVVIVVFSNGKLLCHGRTSVDLMLDQMFSQTGGGTLFENNIKIMNKMLVFL